MGRKSLYLVAAFLISGCSYSAEVRAFDGPYGGPYGGSYAGSYAGSPSYYQPVAYLDSGQPIFAEPLYIGGVPVSFNPIDDGVYELVDPDGYVIGYAYVDGVDRLRITDLEGNTLYFLNYDSGAGYFSAFDSHGGFLSIFAHSHLVHHFHSNRHHFNTSFFHSGRRAGQRFRFRADKHRRAGLRQRGHHDGRRFASHGLRDRDTRGRRDRKFSSRGLRDRDTQGHRHGKRKERVGGHRKKHVKGSGWKPVHHSGPAGGQFDASPRRLNTGGANFGGDFPFQPRSGGHFDASPRGLNTGGAVFGGDFPFQPQAQPQRKSRGKGNRGKTKRRASRGQHHQQPAATQATPAHQAKQQTRRAVNAAPSSPPPQAVRTTKSSAPKSQPARHRAQAQRSRPSSHKSGPRGSQRRR